MQDSKNIKLDLYAQLYRHIVWQQIVYVSFRIRIILNYILSDTNNVTLWKNK